MGAYIGNIRPKKGSKYNIKLIKELTMEKQKLVFTPSKVDADHPKIEAYLKGEQIFPTTVELDLTQLCSRSCVGCPYGIARAPGLTLQLPFLERLFSVLGPHTPGIVFSGGEPTITPHFSEVIKLAHKKGFKEIAIISNGANIHEPKIQNSLMEYATAIRISQYDWQLSESEHFINTLKKIENLRQRIDATGSKLEIGAAMLTRTKFNHRYKPVGQKVLDAGIHWLYFHPYCVDWNTPNPKQDDQTGVLQAIEDLKVSVSSPVNIQVPYARYSLTPLFFEKLHGSHFLIQIGADGINYAGPECKYEKDFALFDLNGKFTEEFLWSPQRIEKLNQISSANYRFIGTKHRPPMFSDYVQKIIDKKNGIACGSFAKEQQVEFAYPNII
jgi:hypothetical protein